MAKKSAVFKDTNTNRETLTLTQNADNSISLEVNNIKGVLRLIANQLNFNYDAEWTTQQFGRELIKQISGDESAKRAEFKDKDDTNAKITLIRNDDSSIELEVNNDKGLMRLIAKALNFAYDESWNTQTLGSKLIDAINNPTTNTAQSETATAEQEADPTAKFFRWYEVYGSHKAYMEAYPDGNDEMEKVSDEAWNWWKDLSGSMKALILEQYREVIEDEDLPMLVYKDWASAWDDVENDEEDVEPWFMDRDHPFISFLLQDYISNTTELSFKIAEDEGHSINSYNMNQLAYLPHLEEIAFDDTRGFGLPFELMQLPHIKRLNFKESDLGYDCWDKLIGFALTHPQMEYLIIQYTRLEEHLAKEPEKVEVLRTLMPNCEIISKKKLSTKKADQKIIDKYINTENVLWWKEADDFSRYVYLLLRQQNKNSKFASFALPTFEETNGFKIISSELELNDVLANNALLWCDLNSYNAQDANPILLEEFEGKITNLEKYDFSHLSKLFRFIFLDVDKEFPYHLSQMKRLVAIHCKQILQENITGFDNLRRVDLYGSEIFPVGLATLKSLEDLTVTGITAMPEETIVDFENLESLTLKWLDGSNVPFPTCLSELKSLTSLYLSCSESDGSVSILMPDELFGFEKLETVGFRNSCKTLSVEDVIKFAKLPNLERISLPEHLCEDKIIEQIKQHFSDNVRIW